MITAVVLFAVAIAAFAYVVCAVGEIAEHESREVTCRCGSHIVRVVCVDPVDAKRHAELLTENCPGCRRKERSAIAHLDHAVNDGCFGQEVDLVH